MEKNNIQIGMRGFMSMYEPVNMVRAYQKWIVEQDVKEFLNYAVSSTVVLGDLLVGGGVHGQISPELILGFKKLMGDKADSVQEIEHILQEKLLAGDSSVMGMINKIKGQIGENYFIDSAKGMGLEASLAESGNQEGWDAVIGHGVGEAKQYIQVKTYESADAVIQQMKEVSEKIDAGVITDGETVVKAIDFAVPEEIYLDVVSKAQELSLSSNIIPFDLTSFEAAEFVRNGFDAMGVSGIDSILSRFASNSGTAIALHIVIAACFVRKRESFLEEISTQGVISSGGVATALLTESALKGLGIATGSIPAIGFILLTSVMARGVFHRIISRDDYNKWLELKTAQLKSTIQHLGQDTFVASNATSIKIAN